MLKYKYFAQAPILISITYYWAVDLILGRFKARQTTFILHTRGIWY